MIPSLYGGGAERVCCTLASALAEDHDVLILYQSEKGHAYLLDPRVRTARLQIPDDGPGHPMQKLLRPLRKIRVCQRVKADFRPDVTVSFLYHYTLLNILSGGRGRRVCSERCNPQKVENGKYFRITKWLYRRADHVVFQSELVRDMYGPRVRAHSSVIPNPVDTGAQAAPERAHRIVSMGRLVAQKNQALLIRSFARFHETHPDYTLTVYGEGELREELVRLRDQMGLADCVDLPGNLSDIHARIADAAFFVLPSDYEGQSNALLECMDMGIACISTACEGSTDVIRDGENGLLVPVGGEDALVRAMERLADDEALRQRLGAQAAEDMKAFRPEKVVKEWEKVLFVD